ncbi:hypothetical protein [Leifsonia shinshuensis]
MTPRDAVLARLEELASRPRVGVHSDQLYRFEAKHRLDMLHPKREPDVRDWVEGFLERQHIDVPANWIPVESIATDGQPGGWGDFPYRQEVIPSIWASAASASTPERRECFLQQFGVVTVDEYVVGPRSIFVPRDNGHHRVGAAKLLELPFLLANVNETVSIASQLVVPGHFAAARLMRAVWEACFARGLTPWPPTVSGDGAVRIRVDPANPAPWALLRPDQAASIGLAVQTHVPSVGSDLPAPEDLVSWREWLRWLRVGEKAEGIAAGLNLPDPGFIDMPAVPWQEELPLPVPISMSEPFGSAL